MPAAYWIVVAVALAAVVVLKRFFDKAHDRAADLQTGKDRIKDEYRSQDGELREYQSMCRDLMSSNRELQSALAEHNLTPLQQEKLDGSKVRSSGDADRMEHLRFVSKMRYPEGRQYRERFMLGTFVADLKALCASDSVAATLLCIDSGISMRFEFEYDPVLQSAFVNVTLQIPEGGSCCIYREGESDPQEDWPPVRACVDTMFAHDKEVYLSYEPYAGQLIGIGA